MNKGLQYFIKKRFPDALLKDTMLANQYCIDSVLGQGVFGVTYLAQDVRLNMPVAIKEYFAQDSSTRVDGLTVRAKSESYQDKFQLGLTRFLGEARNLARFRHPNIVPVYNFFEEHGTAYMVMPYEDGESLETILRKRKSMDEEQLIKITVDLLGGLEKLHSAGFLHRDIKPANIYIRKDGTPVLLDFGATRHAMVDKTKMLTVIYTTGYAALEQYSNSNKGQGPWTDIYAMGAVLYRAVTGRTPLDANDRSRAVLRNEPDPLTLASELCRGRYSPMFLHAIDTALRLLEENRPQNVNAWVLMLQKTGKPTTKNNMTREIAIIDAKHKDSLKIREIELEKPKVGEASLQRSDDKMVCDVAGNEKTEKSLPQAMPIYEVEWREPATGMEFVWIRAGRFMMGSSFDNEQPKHEVIISQGFWLGKYPITQCEWVKIMNENPSEYKGDRHPVEMVSWDDVQTFIEILNKNGHGTFCLPTEAQWEYACSAGNDDEDFCFGSEVSLMKRYAWCSENSESLTHPVGEKKANAWGLYDMHGNVWEWVQDWYDAGYYHVSPKVDPKGPNSGSYRVYRGGSFNFGAWRVRSALRYRHSPDDRRHNLGARLVRQP